jgi:hypothetical protein
MSSFNASKIRKAVEEFRPRRPEKFQELIAAKDVIIELREKRASYRSIADLLTRHCLPTCKTSVALFCHKILGEKVRPYRRFIEEQTAGMEIGIEQKARSDIETPPEAIPTTNSSESEPVTATRSRGPRIAQVRMAKPQPTTT